MALEVIGDRWSLVIVRDLMVRGLKTFKEFHDAGERIATNILADRLERLEANGIISVQRDERDRRRVNYRLTDKGIGLAPVLLELLIWGARHYRTAAPCALVESLARNRKRLLAEVERRWREQDGTPILPPFAAPATYRSNGRVNVPVRRHRRNGPSRRTSSHLAKRQLWRQ